MKGQTKLVSFIEACVNVLIGFGVALASQVILFPLFDISVSMTVHIELSLYFTVISIIRSYVVRRGFNWWHHDR